MELSWILILLKEVELSEQSYRPRCLNIEIKMKWSKIFLDFEEVKLWNAKWVVEFYTPFPQNGWKLTDQH